MTPGNGYQNLETLTSCVDTAGNSFQSSALNLIRPNPLVVHHAEEHRRNSIYFLNCDQLVIIPVQHNMTVRLQIIKNLCLSFQNAVSGFQKFQMA